MHNSTHAIHGFISIISVPLPDHPLARPPRPYPPSLQVTGRTTVGRMNGFFRPACRDDMLLWDIITEVTPSEPAQA